MLANALAPQFYSPYTREGIWLARATERVPGIGLQGVLSTALPSCLAAMRVPADARTEVSAALLRVYGSRIADDVGDGMDSGADHATSKTVLHWQALEAALRRTCPHCALSRTRIHQADLRAAHAMDSAQQLLMLQAGERELIQRIKALLVSRGMDASAQCIPVSMLALALAQSDAAHVAVDFSPTGVLKLCMLVGLRLIAEPDGSYVTYPQFIAGIKSYRSDKPLPSASSLLSSSSSSSDGGRPDSARSSSMSSSSSDSNSNSTSTSSSSSDSAERQVSRELRTAWSTCLAVSPDDAGAELLTLEQRRAMLKAGGVCPTQHALVWSVLMDSETTPSLVWLGQVLQLGGSVCEVARITGALQAQTGPAAAGACMLELVGRLCAQACAQAAPAQVRATLRDVWGDLRGGQASLLLAPISEQLLSSVLTAAVNAEAPVSWHSTAAWLLEHDVKPVPDNTVEASELFATLAAKGVHLLAEHGHKPAFAAFLAPSRLAEMPELRAAPMLTPAMPPAAPTAQDIDALSCTSNGEHSMSSLSTHSDAGSAALLVAPPLPQRAAPPLHVALPSSAEGAHGPVALASPLTWSLSATPLSASHAAGLGSLGWMPPQLSADRAAPAAAASAPKLIDDRDAETLRATVNEAGGPAWIPGLWADHAGENGAVSMPALVALLRRGGLSLSLAAAAALCHAANGMRATTNGLHLTALLRWLAGEAHKEAGSGSQPSSRVSSRQASVHAQLLQRDLSAKSVASTPRSVPASPQPASPEAQGKSRTGLELPRALHNSSTLFPKASSNALLLRRLVRRALVAEAGLHQPAPGSPASDSSCSPSPWRDSPRSPRASASSSPSEYQPAKDVVLALLKAPRCRAAKPTGSRALTSRGAAAGGSGVLMEAALQALMTLGLGRPFPAQEFRAACVSLKILRSSTGQVQYRALLHFLLEGAHPSVVAVIKSPPSSSGAKATGTMHNLASTYPAVAAFVDEASPCKPAARASARATPQGAASSKRGNSWDTPAFWKRVGKVEQQLKRVIEARAYSSVGASQAPHSPAPARASQDAQYQERRSLRDAYVWLKGSLESPGIGLHALHALLAARKLVPDAPDPYPDSSELSSAVPSSVALVRAVFARMCGREDVHGNGRVLERGADAARTARVCFRTADGGFVTKATSLYDRYLTFAGLVRFIRPMSYSTQALLRKVVSAIAARSKSGGGSLDLTRAMARTDQSGDGELNLAELLTLCREVGQRPSPAELQAVLDYFDVDGDEQVQLNELLGAVSVTLADAAL